MSGPLKVCSCRNILFFPINHVAFFPHQLHGENPELRKIKWAQSGLFDGDYWNFDSLSTFEQFWFLNVS